MTEMSEEAGSIRMTCSEGSSLGTKVSFVCLVSCCFFVTVDKLLVDVCAATDILEAAFILAASGGDLTLSVVPLPLAGWYLGMGNLRFL